METKKFIKQIQSVDKGNKFGLFGDGAKRIFFEESEEHLKPVYKFVESKRGNTIKIADLGGANGILAKILVSKYKNLEVDVLDVDASKFKCKIPKINFKFQDARNPLGNKYDCIIARCLLHYNSPKDQIKIFKNIKDALNPNGIAVIIQQMPSEKEMDKAQYLYDLLSSLKGSNKKYCLSLKTTIRLIGFGGLKLKHFKKLNGGIYSLRGFYKGRYSLSEDQLEELECSIGCNSIKMPTYVLTLIK